MSTLQVTQVGYDKIQDAQAKGYKLAITHVKFGDGTGYIPSKDDTGLHGNVLTSSTISNCDVITNECLDFLCICPEGLGDITISIGEIGLYLDSGELFALGCYSYPFNKAPGARFKTHAICLSPYLSTAIDLTLVWTM